jgi:hypothetical protein
MAKQTKKNIVTKDKLTQDSFTNFLAKIGVGTDNLSSYSTYSLNNLISRNRTLLEAAYRSSWLVGISVDAIAEDMTQAGITMGSEMEPDNIKKLHVAMNDFIIWSALCSTIKWSRLYGGAIAVILIDGAKYDEPLNLNAIGKGTFKGLLVLDRWMCEPSLGELVDDLNKDFGKPKYYKIHTSVGNAKLPRIRVHYSRILRFDGIELPFYQRLYENHWGLSVVERLYDRLLAYDSATLGAAQLLSKASLRTIGVKNLRAALALGGKEEAAVIKQFNYIRQMQSNEGITLLDSEDTFDIKRSSFDGISDLLVQFGQQISGATGIPLVRLFGQSPSGFNGGETDLRNYYDGIKRLQGNVLKDPLLKVLEVMSASILEQRLPEDFEIEFNSLWQMSDKEKAELNTSDSSAIREDYGAGIITKELALKEKLQSSRTTGRYTNITEEDIAQAKIDDENKPPEGGTPGMPPSGVGEENPLGAGEESTSSGIEEKPKEGISLESTSPEKEQSKEIKSPIEGVESSINEKEQESKRGLDFKAIRDKMFAARKYIRDKFFGDDFKGGMGSAGYSGYWTANNPEAYMEFRKMHPEKIDGKLMDSWIKGYAGYSSGSNTEWFNKGANYRRKGTEDADFEESKHPRGNPQNAGQFSSGGGGGAKKEEKPTKKEEKAPAESKKPQGVFKEGMDIPEEGRNVSAVKLEDGTVYYDTKAMIHADMLENNPDIPADKIVDGGFIVNGKYVSGSANAKGIGEQAKAKKIVEGLTSGSSVKFVKMDNLDKVKVKTINEAGLSEQQIKKVLSFDGYDTEVFYDFPKRMPGVTYVVATAIGKGETATKGKEKDVIETTFSVDNDKPDDLHLDFMEVYGSKNKGIAKAYLDRIEQYARENGKKTISLLADISIGRYAWAKMGFKADQETVDRLRKELIVHASNVLKMKYGGTNEFGKKRRELITAIEPLKSVEEIADFEFPDTEYTAKELTDSKGFHNNDVPMDMKLKVGKSFLLNSKGGLENDWHGTREVKKKTGDSLGTLLYGELETKDAEGEPTRMLLFTNEERGTKEGETDIEFHKDILFADSEKEVNASKE